MAIEIKNQVSLSLGRCFEFCVSSIRHRFVRSMVTLAVIVLAVAFLMNILTEGIITREVAVGLEKRFATVYASARFMKRTNKDVSVHDYRDELTKLKPGSLRWKELMAWSGFDSAAFNTMVSQAKTEKNFERFFEELDYARRKQLVKNNKSTTLFDYLAAPQNQAAFKTLLGEKAYASIQIPGGVDALFTFANGWKAYRSQIAVLKMKATAALIQAEAELKKPIREALVQASSNPAAQTALDNVLKKIGIQTTPDEMKHIYEQVRLSVEQDSFYAYTKDSEFRSRWHLLRRREDYSSDRILLHYRTDRSMRTWVAERSTAISLRSNKPLPCTWDELQELSIRFSELVWAAGATDETINGLDKNKAEQLFIQAIRSDAFRNVWPKAPVSDDYSTAKAMQLYSSNGRFQVWADLVFKRAAGPEGVGFKSSDAVRLYNRFEPVMLEKGIAAVPLDGADIGASPAEKKLIIYLGEKLFRASWTELSISGSRRKFSVEHVLLVLADPNYRVRVTDWIERIEKTISERNIQPLLVKEIDLMAISALHAERKLLQERQAEVLRRGGSSEGVGDRTFWLIVVSFLVCVVGIANAMLMAVTERFREIATMKCLGALDSFIMTIFLMESGLQGMIGAMVGVLLGLTLAMFRCFLAYGDYAFIFFPFGAIGLNILVSTVAGMVLAVLASAYPSWVASRMAPMEAMRVE